MPLAYDQSLISASSTSGFEIGVLPEDDHHGTPVDLPADPKHAVWALAAAATHQKKLPQKSSFANAHSHSPHGAPTMSTFSASSLGHIHIVQPYRPTAPPTQSNNPSDSSGGNPALSNGCSTSTFSVHPTSASTPYSFSNPYCTNQLHSLIPGMGSTPGTGGPGQPPRPANAWILYRSDKMKDIAPSVPGKAKPPQADISKLIAAMWKSEQPEVRQHYEALSDMKKAEHLALYPGYRFQPMKKADREKVRAERKAEKEKERLASAAKSHRKPKPKRAATEETVALEESEAEARQEQQQQHQGHAANSDPTSPLSPAARMRTFAYKPYTVPSPGPMSPSAMSAGAAPLKRKRPRAKVEASNPALPSEDTVQSEYVPVPQHSVRVTNTFFEHHGHGRANNDYAYNSPGGLLHGYHMSTPQLSSGSNSDPNSHPTPPYSTVHPGALSNSTPPHALSATLESVGGQHDIFQFTDFDAANLLNNPGAEIEVTLPEDFNFDLMDGLGLGLEDSGLGFENGGGMGFAEFSNMASSGPMEDLAMGFGDYSLADKGNLAVNPQTLAYSSNPHDSGLGLQYDANYGISSNNHRSPPQHLELSTHALHQPPSDRMSIPPSATSEHFSVTSPIDNAAGFYGPFAPPQQHYGGMDQYHDQQQQQQQQQYYPMHGYTSPPPQGYMQYNSQGYTSPPHSSFTSPPPMEEDPMSPTGTSRGTRAATASWQ